MDRDNVNRRSSKVSTYPDEEDNEGIVQSPLDSDKHGKSSMEAPKEYSPLLTPRREEDDNNPLQSGTSTNIFEHNGDDEEESKSHWYLFILTLGIGG